MNKIQERIKAIKAENALSELNLQRTDKDMPLLNHVVPMKKGNIANLEHRQARFRWLIGKFGCRGERWDMIIRSEGGTTFLFKDRDDAIMFKVTWAGG